MNHNQPNNQKEPKTSPTINTVLLNMLKKDTLSHDERDAIYELIKNSRNDQPTDKIDSHVEFRDKDNSWNVDQSNTIVRDDQTNIQLSKSLTPYQSIQNEQQTDQTIQDNMSAWTTGWGDEHDVEDQTADEININSLTETSDHETCQPVPPYTYSYPANNPTALTPNVVNNDMQLFHKAEHLLAKMPSFAVPIPAKHIIKQVHQLSLPNSYDAKYQNEPTTVASSPLPNNDNYAIINNFQKEVQK